MHKVIGVTQLQRHFRAVLDEVAREHVPYVLARGSRPEAALVSYEDFLRLQKLDEDTVLARFDAVWDRLDTRNAGFTDAEIDADVKAAIADVRAEERIAAGDS